jgi:hypothetical protein
MSREPALSRFEYRIQSRRTHHVTALTETWAPATLARIADELAKLARLRDPTAILEVRRRTVKGA